jgi:hypothetical protein
MRLTIRHQCFVERKLLRRQSVATPLLGGAQRRGRICELAAQLRVESRIIRLDLDGRFRAAQHGFLMMGA